MLSTRSGRTCSKLSTGSTGWWCGWLMGVEWLGAWWVDYPRSLRAPLTPEKWWWEWKTIPLPFGMVYIFRGELFNFQGTICSWSSVRLVLAASLQLERWILRATKRSKGSKIGILATGGTVTNVGTRRVIPLLVTNIRMEKNPAPVDMVHFQLFTGFHTCWVVPDFFQQYPPTVPAFFETMIFLFTICDC